MENNSKYYWNSINTGYKNYPFLSSNEKCDVVVIGGGISGCLTAYYLSQYNLNTILLEKNFIAQGNASTSTGILETTADIEINELSKLIGKKDAFYAHMLCEKAVDDIEYILYNINLSHILEKKDMLYSINNEHAKNGAIKDVHRHSYSKKCVLVDPFKLCHGLLRSSQKKHAKIYENTAAIGFESYTNTLRINTNTSHYIECKKIVFTNGLSINNILPLKNLIDIKNINTIVTTPLRDCLDILNKNYLLNYNNDYTYIRSTCDKRIMISSFNSDSNLHTNEKLLELFKNTYEYSKNLEVEYSFTAPYGESIDGLPYIGAHPKLENCYLNLALGRNHICYSAIGAQIIRDLILYNTSPYEDLFAFKRN
jgi:glycine/D-amino acid oxidase-like deaminating enzyme